MEVAIESVKLRMPIAFDAELPQQSNGFLEGVLRRLDRQAIAVLILTHESQGVALPI